MYNFKIKTEYLRQFFEIVNSLVDEVIIKISGDGWKSSIVDPAHVAMCELEMDKKLFNTYNMDKGAIVVEIGVDIDKIKPLLKLCEEHKIMELEGEFIESVVKHKDLEIPIWDIKFTSNRVTRRIKGLPTNELKWGKIPKMELPVSKTVSVDDLMLAMKGAGDVSDHIQLIADKDGLRVRAHADSVDEYIEIPLTKEMTEERHISLFSIDYMENIVKVLPSKKVTMIMGTDYPVRMDFEYLDGKGRGKMILAPRIESE